MKTNKEVAQDKKNAVEDRTVGNSLAQPGWKIMYKQKYMVTVNNVYIKDDAVTYLVKGQDLYFELPESSLSDYLGTGDYILIYPK